MMKKLIIIILPLVFISCVTVSIPEQIKEEFAYKKIFDVDFEKTINAAVSALEDLGWKVSYVSRSKLIKKDRTLDSEPKYQAYIFTEIRQFQLFLTSSYSTFNVRISALGDHRTEVALRYLSMTPIPPFYNKKINYKNDKLVEKFYKNTEQYLGK